MWAMRWRRCWRRCLALTWIDSRDGIFPAVVPQGVV